MDCRDFENCLDLLEAGLLPLEKQRHAVGHANSCLRCRRLLAFVRGEEVAPASDAHKEMTLAIMERTTGTVCAVAEERLCDYVDGHLDQDGGKILSLHLAHCSRCSSKAEVLRELQEILPSLAAIEPDDRFAEDVLQATVGGGAGYQWDRARTALRAWWLRMLRRPRFAWEAAYVGTLLLLIALGNPAVLPAANEVPQALVQRSDRLFQETTRVIAERKSAARRSFDNLQSLGEDLLERAAAFQTRTTSELRQDLTSVFARLKTGLLGEDPEAPATGTPR
jgi:hypothetical protein